jgi:hypothetical protein
MDIKFKPGDKVSYVPFKGCDTSLIEKGMVKSLSHNTGYVFVVFHCAGEWDKFQDYTAQTCDIDRLVYGWDNTFN